MGMVFELTVRNTWHLSQIARPSKTYM